MNPYVHPAFSLIAAFSAGWLVGLVLRALIL